LLRTAFGEPDLAGPEEELIRDLAQARPPADEEKGPNDESAI
jgi:hypothetical protein